MTHSCPTRRSADLSEAGVDVRAAHLELGRDGAYRVGGLEGDQQRALLVREHRVGGDVDVARCGRRSGDAGLLEAAEAGAGGGQRSAVRSEEHTSELQSLMRISYAVFCLKKK